ncbi:hypothetical protein [Aeoliella mucimassa]|uniref:Uncharacterized protein n=1 Tax=Aeoliella mucimassa TaxID=2527972 RepID=A0A518AJ89_9BACT|nr:hypothetical protein [Aeoliella mucimassa]QDU54798.1 hypothetical protein Pan181_09810 [Aeoliella mucimassa]
MTQIESIQAAIESLSSEEFAALRIWFEQRDWQAWDQQIESDSASGKLDFLKEEARRAEQAGDLREL